MKSSSSSSNLPSTSTSSKPQSSPAFDAYTDEELQKDKSLLDLLVKLEEFTPIIPDELTDHFFAKAGVQSDDPKIKKLIALMAQKFISDIATDALQYNRLKQQNTQLKDRRKDRKVALTMEDLISSLADYGIHIKRPSYFM